MGKTASLFHFDEPSGVQPHDVAGGLDDLVVPAGFTVPLIVPGTFGMAREFPSGSGLEGTEAVTGQLCLRRSMSIEVNASIDQMLLTNGRYMIACRGRRLSIAERRLWSLFLDVTGAPSAPVIKMSMGWDLGTTPAFVPGCNFQVSAPGFFQMVATREWISPTLVNVAYYVNGVSLGSFTVSGGAIVDGDGGHVAVGYESFGTSGLNFYIDAIDDLRISNVVRTPEEIAGDYLRMFQFQPWGYEAIRAFAHSMGDAYSRNPASSIQQELMVDGDALGYAWSKLDELLTQYFPDSATSMLDRWETICKIQPGPLDTTTTRRNRILAFLRKIAGYSVSQIVIAIAPVLACTPDQLQVIENDNTSLDPDLVFVWFIFRDPSIPGTPDLVTAQRIINDMKPAHTLGVVGQSTAFKCDDPFSLCDRDILGS